MGLPELVHYKTASEYKEHFKSVYCRREIYTFDKIKVYFKPDKFNHAFYEAPLKDGVKSGELSQRRAERIDWIKYVLEHNSAAGVRVLQGWNKTTKKYESSRRVSLMLDSYVVVIELRKKDDGTLKGNFVTAFVVDDGFTLNRMKNAPEWDLEDL